MSGNGLSEGAVTRTELTDLAELFDRFEFAFDPRAMSAKEAESEFERRARALFEERVASRHPEVPFALFHNRLRFLCRVYLRRNPAPLP